MKPLKIAMMGMTHGHTRKYYQTLLENQKLDWVASCAEDENARQVALDAAEHLYNFSYSKLASLLDNKL